MKKYLLMGLSFVLVAVLAIGGTLAYLTDRDSAVNVFTMGNVEIQLNEDFEQGAELIPGKDIEKTPTITNTGDNDAWVWMTVAIPRALEGEDLVASADNIVHWNILGATLKGYNTTDRASKAVDAGYLTEDQLTDGKVADGDTWTMVDAVEVTIDGEKYALNVLKYNGTLVPGETTTPSMYNIYLDAHVDCKDGKYYMIKDGVATPIEYDLSNVKVLVGAYAIQADEFDSVDAAYDAYADQWGLNGGVEYEEPAIVNNSEELAAAIANGGDVYLNTGSYTLPANLSNVNLIGQGDVTVAAPAVDATAIATLGDNVTVSGIDFDVDGDSNADTAVLLVKGENVTVENCTFDITDTNYSAIAIGGNTDNTVIKNCNFVNGYKQIGPADGTPGDITIEGCTFGGTSSTYGIHLNVTSNNVLIKDSTMSLFNTFYGDESSTGTLTFDNCDFVYTSNGYTNCVRLYRDATFNNCDFAKQFLLANYHEKDGFDITVTFNGGTWEGWDSVKKRVLDDSFSGNLVTAVFEDGETYTYDLTEKAWIKQ